MEWLELTIQTASSGVELTAAALTLWGYDSFVIDDQAEFEEFLENNHEYWDYVDEQLQKEMNGVSRIRLYLENGPAAMDQLSQLRSQLAQLPSLWPDADLGSLSLSFESIQEEDWANNWKQYYRPLEIGDKLMIVPKWLDPPNPEKRIRLLLDPGMIFGTGNHASTRMCLQALETAVSGGEDVLDLGSGSGILGIAALLLGASHALGVDIDPKAESIARENAAFNGLYGDRFAAYTGNVLGDAGFAASLKSHTGYDLVLANIVADVIIPLAPLVPGLLKEKGLFICSGILKSRLDEVREAILQAGLELVQTRETEDWCQLTAKRKED